MKNNFYEMETSEPTQTREEAIKWWNLLDKSDRLRYWCNFCVNHYSPSTRPDELTGREIELLKKEFDF